MVSNLVEIYEEKRYKIYCKNKPDAEKVLKQIIQSQDKVIDLQSRRWGYEATVECFCARDYPEGKRKG